MPLLIPGLLYHRLFDVECIDPNGAAGRYTCDADNHERHCSVIVAVVNMPICEIIPEDQ